MTSGHILKEILRNKLSLTSGWPEILSMASVVQILNMTWALFSVPVTCILSVVKTKSKKKLSSNQ